VIVLVWLRAEIRAGLAVNRDVTSGDQFVAMAARADSSGGKKAIETHGVINEALKPSKVKLNLDNCCAISGPGNFIEYWRSRRHCFGPTGCGFARSSIRRDAGNARVSDRYRRKNAGELAPYRVTSVQ
jgi:hypothetical protein